MTLNRNLPPVEVSQFSMVPRAEIPRSVFATQHTLKTCFQAGSLIPIHVDEVLPADHHAGEVTIFARLNTMVLPVMDNVMLETFFFFVPCRLLWVNWEKFMGARENPSDSISYTIPQVVSPVGGFPINSIFDYFGLPTAGQVDPTKTVSVNALPLRAYNLIYHEWFRDENLDTARFNKPSATGPGHTWDGPDTVGTFAVLVRNKKHDYFTSCLPYPVKGGAEVGFFVTGQAPVRGLGIDGGGSPASPTAGSPTVVQTVAGSAPFGVAYYAMNNPKVYMAAQGTGLGAAPNVYADLSSVTGITLNTMRLAVATQQLLEKDMRGGTRYTELLRQHFGVRPEDARLQRPEYIGGGRSQINVNAIPQTSATGLTGSATPLGALGAQGVASGQHRFSYHATEHGYIIGLVHVTAEITYQQGLHRMWTRQTRYDFYWPTFANLGEQVVRNDEIYCRGDANDSLAFGYQERWAEYRHRPSRITGLFRSTHAGTLEVWHLSQKYTSLPTLSAAWMKDAPPLARALAAGAAADNAQVLFDSVFNIRCTRAMPQYSVPGLARF